MHCAICSRQLKPSAMIRVSSEAFRTAGQEFEFADRRLRRRISPFQNQRLPPCRSNPEREFQNQSPSFGELILRRSFSSPICDGSVRGRWLCAPALAERNSLLFSPETRLREMFACDSRRARSSSGNRFSISSRKTVAQLGSKYDHRNALCDFVFECGESFEEQTLGAV